MHTCAGMVNGIVAIRLQVIANLYPQQDFFASTDVTLYLA
jgi:hypothetical protein